MRFDDKYFTSFAFSKEQTDDHFSNAKRDLEIARKDEILDVKFNYAYTALIKAGIALLSCYKTKVKSIPGHHMKIIEAIAKILEDNEVEAMGNAMRSKRNVDMYSGGAEITEKECHDYIEFVNKIINKIKVAIKEIHPG